MKLWNLFSKKEDPIKGLHSLIEFDKNYDGKIISNDIRSMMIGNPPFEIYYGKWVKYKDSKYNVVSFYYNLVVDTKQQALEARMRLCPPNYQIPQSVYFEIWTSDGKFIAGRDCLNDYELNNRSSEDNIIGSGTLVKPNILEEIRQNNIDGVKNYLKNNENVNCLLGRQPNIFSPLILSCQYGYFDIIKLLIQNGADVNFIGNPMYKTTALLETSRQGNPEIFKYLLDKGANIDYVDAEGWDARRFAEHFNHSEILQIINNINPRKKKNEVDKIYSKSWTCGRCNTSNHIDLDNCNSCGKEFNPPL